MGRMPTWAGSGRGCPWGHGGRSGVCRVGWCRVGRGRHEENSLSRDKSLSQDSGRSVFGENPVPYPGAFDCGHGSLDLIN